MSQDIPASSKRHQLDQLSVEIIRQIAASGPYASALSLLQANRTMHDACKDWTVFKALSRTMPIAFCGDRDGHPSRVPQSSLRNLSG